MGDGDANGTLFAYRHPFFKRTRVLAGLCCLALVAFLVVLQSKSQFSSMKKIVTEGELFLPNPSRMRLAGHEIDAMLTVEENGRELLVNKQEAQIVLPRVQENTWTVVRVTERFLQEEARQWSRAHDNITCQVVDVAFLVNEPTYHNYFHEIHDVGYASFFYAFHMGLFNKTSPVSRNRIIRVFASGWQKPIYKMVRVGFAFQSFLLEIQKEDNVKTCCLPPPASLCGIGQTRPMYVHMVCEYVCACTPR